MSVIERILNALFVVHEIGRKGLPRYLTRWEILGQRFGANLQQKLFLHCFHRGDAEDYFHDHPWPFWSLILWGGYWEWTPSTIPEGICCAHCRKAATCFGAYEGNEACFACDNCCGHGNEDGHCKPVLVKEKCRWYGPGSLLRRPADWKHRVELPQGKKCWTLIWCGKKVRSWGFWCPVIGFIGWRQHQASQDAGGSGCE